MNPPEKVIKVKNLTKEFTTKLKDPGLAGSLRSLVAPKYWRTVAVNKVSFDIDQGEFLAFIGPNGAGKSTTIKMLTGILHPTAGKADVLGFNPWQERQQLAFQIGSVFGQKPQLWYHLPPMDSFNLFAKIYEVEESVYRKHLNYLVDAFEIEDLLKTPVRKLSLGQRMRCEIVASLLHQPKIILLDEPTIGLDVIAKQKIRSVLKMINGRDKTTIFLTSHDAGDVEDLCRRVIVINQGKVVFDDATETLKKNYLGSKVIEVTTREKLAKVAVPQAQILKKEDHYLRLKVDTRRVSLASVLAWITGNLQVVDINIADPPMEEIIARIYREQK